MKEKKHRLNSNNIFKGLMIFILIYLLFRAVPLPFSKKFNTMRPNVATYMSSFKTRGVIIKDEKTYYSTNKGNIETFVKEGARAPAGSRVAVLTSLDGSHGIEEELEQINKSINEINSIKFDTENLDMESKEEVIKNLKFKIQEEIKNNKLDNIYILREQLSAITLGTEGENTKVDNTIMQLESRREELFKALHENIKDYYIDQACMISYKVDGFEEKYLPEDFEKYSYESISKDMEIEKSGTRDPKDTLLEANQAIFKTIDNFKWNLAIKVDDLKTLKNIENKKTLKFKINDRSDELEGKIIKVNKFKNKGVVVLELRSKLQDYYSERFPNIEVIESNTLGFKVPKSALVEKEQTKGVMVKDISNIARFRPVVVLAEDKDNMYLKMGDENGYLKTEKDEVIRTISLFDEIFLKPKGIKDGKIME